MGFFVLADVIRDELQQRLLLPALFSALDYKRDSGRKRVRVYCSLPANFAYLGTQY